jgi:hypothetical protein
MCSIWVQTVFGLVTSCPRNVVRREALREPEHLELSLRQTRVIDPPSLGMVDEPAHAYDELVRRDVEQHRQHKTAGVVRVLADQVHTSRSEDRAHANQTLRQRVPAATSS